MVDNSNMPHPKCLGSQKNPGTEPKTCERGPKLGFEYLPTSKTSHCVRTACMAFPKPPLTATPNESMGLKTQEPIHHSDMSLIHRAAIQRVKLCHVKQPYNNYVL